jgi:arylsulfatase
MSHERPNIVLVTVDSLRADYCGYVDGEIAATPTLDRLADDGLAFETAIAPGPSTPESMPAVFTGKYPVGDADGSDLAVWKDLIGRHMRIRDPLPARLSRLGYETAAFTPNPFTSRFFGFDRGFDHFQDFLGASRTSVYNRLFEGFLRGGSTSSLARVLVNFWQREEVFKPWEGYYDEIIEWAAGATEPYFLWVFLMDAHNPYIAGDDHRSQSRWDQFRANYRFWRESHETAFSSTIHDRLVTAYEDAVRYADSFLEQLRTDLGADDPVIVVHGDHGEAFGEHGTYGHESYLYPENVHVPLVVGNGPSGAIALPYSLRRLPTLVTGIATGTNAVSDSWYAVSKSNQGNRLSVRIPDWMYLHDHETQIVHCGDATKIGKLDYGEQKQSAGHVRGRERSESDNAHAEQDALQPLSEIAETFIEARRERQRIHDAAALEEQR